MDCVSSYNRFLQGDNDGLAELVEMYNRPLILFINGFVNDLFVAEDLAADTFMEILVKRYRFKETAKFKTWLFKIARNNAYDFLRKQSKFRNIPITDLVSEPIDINADLPEEIAINNERDSNLHKAMSKLPRGYAQVLYLLYFEDMSYDNAGRVLKKNNKQIKNLAYRAKKSLKTILEKEDFDYEEFKN
jgi:RNA polymerase sigma-70 factor (ECF subfamily)